MQVQLLPDAPLKTTAVEIVREVHAEAIEAFGGSDGVRDVALLESTAVAPQASFGGKPPHKDLTEVLHTFFVRAGIIRSWMATSALRWARASCFFE